MSEIFVDEGEHSAMSSEDSAPAPVSEGKQPHSFAKCVVDEETDVSVFEKKQHCIMVFADDVKFPFPDPDSFIVARSDLKSFYLKSKHVDHLYLIKTGAIVEHRMKLIHKNLVKYTLVLSGDQKERTVTVEDTLSECQCLQMDVFQLMLNYMELVKLEMLMKKTPEAAQNILDLAKQITRTGLDGECISKEE